MEKFVLQKSTTRAGWWIVTDTENGIVCKFEAHRFNATQQYTFLGDTPLRDPVALAKIPNGIADWLAAFHYDLAMGDATEIEQARTRGTDGLQIGAYIFPVAMTQRLAVGRQVAYFRRAAGFTVRKLAELSGITAQNITKIENGKYNGSVDILTKILTPLNAKLTIADK